MKIKITVLALAALLTGCTGAGITALVSIGKSVGLAVVQSQIEKRAPSIGKAVSAPVAKAARKWCATAPTAFRAGLAQQINDGAQNKIALHCGAIAPPAIDTGASDEVAQVFFHSLREQLIATGFFETAGGAGGDAVAGIRSFVDKWCDFPFAIRAIVGGAVTAELAEDGARLSIDCISTGLIPKPL